MPPPYILFLLNLGEFVILEFQFIAHIHAEGEQGDGDFGDNAGVFVFDEGVVAADIDDGAEHFEVPPIGFGDCHTSVRTGSQ